jgi:hypothetical protein
MAPANFARWHQLPSRSAEEALMDSNVISFNSRSGQRKEKPVTQVRFLGRLFATVLSDDECKALTADDFRSMIAMDRRAIVRYPDGRLGILNLADPDFDLVRDSGATVTS